MIALARVSPPNPDGTSGSQPMALARRNLHGAAVDQILAQENIGASPPDNVLWHLADNQGTTRDIVDNAGNLETHITYSAFGQPLSGSITTTRYLFTAREYDPATGLQYNRARWYDPAVGRWMSEDSIGFAGGDANLSRYVGNGPTNFTDPDGLERGGWGENTIWWFNPWSWYGVRMIPNFLTGNSDAYQWNFDSWYKTEQRKLWDKGAERGPGDWRYDSYYNRLYTKPLGPSHAGVARGLAELGANQYGAAFGMASCPIVAQNGTRVTGFTRHGINRAIGDAANRAGTTPAAILDALKNPKKIVGGVDSLGRPFEIFTGNDARVVVNPQTGDIVSVNPLSGAGAH